MLGEENDLEAISRKGRKKSSRRKSRQSFASSVRQLLMTNAIRVFGTISAAPYISLNDKEDSPRTIHACGHFIIPQFHI